MFTAPVAELILVMWFTVPFGHGCTIVAIATIVTSCFSAALFCDVFASRCRCGGGFLTPDGTYVSVWDSVMPMTGKFFNYFQFQEFVGSVCMLNYWFSSNDKDICPTTTIFPGSSCRTSAVQ